MKGSLSNFGAEPALEAVLRLEKLGRTGGELAGAEDAYQALEAELERLRPALAALGDLPSQ